MWPWSLGENFRTLRGEYTGEWRDVHKILEEVKSIVSINNYDHIKGILISGCPYALRFEESNASTIQLRG